MNKHLYQMMLPGTIWFIIFCYVPLYGITIAFKKYDFGLGITGSPWNGLDNFKFLFTYAGIGRVFFNTIYFEITGFTDTPYTVCSIDDPYKVVNRMETPEFRTMLEYLQKWYRDGILDKRLLTLSSNEGSSGLALFLGGDKPCETNIPIWSLNRDWLPQLTQAHPEWTYGFFPPMISAAES